MRSLLFAASVAMCTIAAAPAIAGGPPPSSTTMKIFKPVHIPVGPNGITPGPTEIFKLMPTPSTVAAVPEPTTWMTMLAGFGLVGWALRRHMRSQRLVAA